MKETKLTKRQENRLSTFLDIETVLDRNMGRINTIPKMADSVANFKQVISDINTKAELRNTVYKGASETKSQKRTEMENLTFELSSALYSFGHNTSNEVIMAIANMSASMLDRMRDTEITNKANTILTALNENADALVEYGITENEISALSNCIENYKTSSSDKSGSFTEKVVITKSLKELFETGNEILEKDLDRMVNSLQTKDKNFYDSYYAARSVKNLGVRRKKQPESNAPGSPTS
ncbi:MAG: hypothetical protein R3A12_07730 [Ignavibacteria bacterium]